MYKAVVLDLDGTLVSERSYIDHCLAYVGRQADREYGLTDSEQQLRRLFQEKWDRVMNRFLLYHHLPDTRERVTQMVAWYREAPFRTELYPDSIKALTLLRGLGIKTLLLTNGYAAIQREKIAQAGLAAFFDCILVPDERGREFWKPDPRCLAEALSQLNIPPGDCLFVGDSPQDFRTAEALGMDMCCIEREDRVTVFDQALRPRYRTRELFGFLLMLSREGAL